ALLGQMTVKEKVGQMVQINTAFPLTQTWMQQALITDGAGSLLSGGGDVPSPNIPNSWASNINTLQQYAVEHSRLHIPIIYGYDPSHPVIAATDKQFAGYSEPIAGHDRTMAQIPLRYLQETFLRPFEAGVDAGVATAMANSASINNIPVHASHYMLTDVLHDQMGFK